VNTYRVVLLFLGVNVIAGAFVSTVFGFGMSDRDPSSAGSEAVIGESAAKSATRSQFVSNSLVNKECQACHTKIIKLDEKNPEQLISTISPSISPSLSPSKMASASFPVSADQADDCLECHAENDVSARFIRAAQTENAALNSTTEETVESTEALKRASGKGPGMSLVMYYEKSRIGDEPNKMILIPGGEFVMGSNSRLPDEGPEHKTTVTEFWIDQYEVTNYQYKKFIDATRRRSPSHFENRTFPANKIDHPVTYVSWKDANAYCKWADKRLPSDKEWEKAARGTDARIYPWGEIYDTKFVNSPQRWIELKLQGDTTPVGVFEGGKSPYGLYDMSGNVWEWTASWYQAYPGNTQISENYGQTYKTLKGGSWWDCSFYKCGISAPTFNRSFFLRSTKNKSFGFRCAQDKIVEIET